MTTERRLQPERRVRCDARQSDSRPRWLSQMVGPFADTAGRPDPGPLLALWLPHRHAPRSHRCRHSGRGHGTRGHRRGTPDVHSQTLDSGRVDIACADTGRSHRTPDTGRVDATENADRAPRHGRHPDRQPGPHDTRLAAGTPNRGPVDGACGAQQRCRLGDGEVPASARLPTALPGTCSLGRPSRALAHCCPQRFSGRA
jgi:hypothetical protein